MRVIGIDPGTVYVGVAIIDIDDETGQVCEVESFLVEVNREYADNPSLSGLDNRLYILSKAIKKVFKNYAPDTVAMEGTFIHSDKASSVIPLSKALQTIEVAALEYNQFMPIATYPPSIVKKEFSVNGGGDKNSMRDAMGANKVLLQFCTPTEMSEHEIDAVAVAMCHINHLKKNPLMLWRI